MDLNQLRIFVSVYARRSFTRASEELGISQPTISEHIKNLEAELKCRLFDRLPRTVIPTREAEAMYPKAIHIIEEAGELKDAVCLAAGRIRGPIVLGASTIPGTYILPEIAAGFKRDYPEVSFEIKIGDSRAVTDGLLAHELVMGVVGAVMEPEKLEYSPFVEEHLVLAARPGLVGKKTISAADMAMLPFIMRELGSGTRKTMEKYLRENNVRGLHVAAVLGSTDSVKQALKAGLGVSVISGIAVKEEIERGALETIKIKGLGMKRSFYVATHKKRFLPAAYRAFHDYLLERTRA